MRCDFCGKDPNLVIILPMRKADGTLEVFSCLRCAKKSGRYCDKHRRPHLGFADDTTVCLSCVNDEIAGKKPLAQKVYQRLHKGLPPEQFHELRQAALIMAALSNEALSMIVLRWIVVKSHRHGILISEVVNQVIDRGEVDQIIPLLY